MFDGGWGTMSPIYVWVCRDCGMKIERFRHGRHQKPPTRHCDCGGLMELAINPPSLRFIGSGWDTKAAKEDKDA